MKNDIPVKLIIAVICVAACACMNSSQKPADNPINNSLEVDLSVLKVNQLVSVEQMTDWRKRYETFVNSLSRDSITPKNDTLHIKLTETELVKGFTFRTSDLLVALGLENVPMKSEHIRGYFGIDSHGNRKMFFMGVSGANLDPSKGKLSAGRDMFFKSTVSMASSENDSTFGLDLNYPCPTLCPPTGIDNNP